MTRYKKEGFRKTFINNDGFKQDKPVFIKSKVKVVFLVGCIVVGR